MDSDTGSCSLISSGADLAPVLQASLDKIIRALIDTVNEEMPLTPPRRAQFMLRVFRDWDSDKPIPSAPPPKLQRPDAWTYFVKAGTIPNATAVPPAPKSNNNPRKKLSNSNTKRSNQAKTTRQQQYQTNPANEAYIRARVTDASSTPTSTDIGIKYEWADGTHRLLNPRHVHIVLNPGWDISYVHASACLRRDMLEKEACARHNTAVALFKARQRVAFWATIQVEERSKSLRMCEGGEARGFILPKLAGEVLKGEIASGRLVEVRREYKRGVFDVAWLAEDDE
ncbi:hypothetical protein B0T19DRAFT_236712 [Cercophora scortea]|uniref:Uncharacterized protein n=1 Tax=Cercophora scortea TaxID=314031 RepID=A0AAE0IGK0_9PEZI|nr:hypothetical protein B0T19DRAFT_236712 [Cercophora scortea]